MTEATPLPATASLIDWFQLSTRTRPFLEGAAAITLAAEGQVPGAFGPFARALEEHYGLSREDVAFWDVHEVADRDHSNIGRSAVLSHGDTPESRDGIRQAVKLVHLEFASQALLRLEWAHGETASEAKGDPLLVTLSVKSSSPDRKSLSSSRVAT